MKKKKLPINIAPVDRFTFVHAGVGVAMGRYTRVSFFQALALTVAWELLENNFLKQEVPQWFPRATIDSPENAIFDSIAFLAGWGLGRKMR